MNLLDQIFLQMMKVLICQRFFGGSLIFTSFCPVAWLRNWKKPNLHKPAKEQDKREHKIPVIKHIGPNNMNKTDLVAPIYDRQQIGPIVAYFRTKTAPTCLRRI